MKYAIPVFLAAAMLFTAAHADERDHKDRHVWHQGEYGYQPSYGGPYYGEPVYGSGPFITAPTVGIQVPGVGVQIR
jgi:hypothetical protein